MNTKRGVLIGLMVFASAVSTTRATADSQGMTSADLVREVRIDT